MRLRYVVMCLTLALFMGESSASVVMFEMGEYVLIINDDWEIQDSSNTDWWPLLAGFESPSSREDYEHDVYVLKLGEVLEDTKQDIGVVFQHPTIYIWKKSRFEGLETSDPGRKIGIGFESHIDSDVEVGRVKKTNTSLYTGEFTLPGGTKKTPYYVGFDVDNKTECLIYIPSSTKSTFVAFLGNIDILPKNGLTISEIWTE